MCNYSTNNIKCMCVVFTMSHYNDKMVLLQYLKGTDKPKAPLPSQLKSISEGHFQQADNYIQKTVGDKEATTIGGMGQKQCHQYNEYSTKEKTNADKYTAENGVRPCVLIQVTLYAYTYIPMTLCHLANTHYIYIYVTN